MHDLNNLTKENRKVVHSLCIIICINQPLKARVSKKSLKLITVYWSGKFVCAIWELQSRKTGIWPKKSFDILCSNV